MGWTRYTDDPNKLMKAIQNSSYVITFYKNSELIGLIRGLSDGVSVHLIQDILVHPTYQRQGLGRELLNKALETYSKVYKHVLLTANEFFQKEFYASMGFKNLIHIHPLMNTYIKLEIIEDNLNDIILE